MELVLDVEGPDQVKQAAELQTWLREARVGGIEKLRQEERPPGPGEQGPTLLAILTILLGSQAVVKLVRSIHRYIEARRPKTKITIKHGKKTIVSPPPLSELEKLAKGLEAS
jgi:hypothetical protein